MYVIDTYAWIEYLEGTEKGKIVAKLLSKYDPNENNIATPSFVLMELHEYCLRRGRDFRQTLAAVDSNSTVLEITREMWIDAAAINERMKRQKPGWGKMDSLLMVYLLYHGNTIVTGDSHFKGIRRVLFLG